MEKELQGLDTALYERLKEIKECAKAIWKEPKLRWHTDHGPNHSDRVVKLIGQILAPLYPYREGTSPPLSAHELYILLTACHLHDIGMQNLSVDPEIPVEELGPQEYKLIRDRHPHASFVLIRNRVVGSLGRGENRIPLDADEHLMPIAHVAQAHGTEFFDESCQNLRRITKDLRFIDDQRPVRGEMLAALLMMGDELDLSSVRATFPDMEKHSPETLLHNYKHHYIKPGTGVRDGATPQDREVFVWFEFPPDAQEAGYDAEIRNWVLNKLACECNRVKAVLWETLQLRCDKVSYKIDYDTSGYRRPLPAEVHLVLEKMRCERVLVNRDELIALLKNYLQSARPGNEVVVAWGDTHSDLEYIAEWFLAACACETNITVRDIDFSTASYGKRDVQSETEPFFAPSTQGILVLSNVQLAQIDVFRWLRAEWLPKLVKPVDDRMNVVVILGEGEASQWEYTPLTVRHIKLQQFDEEDLVKHFTSKRACSVDEAHRAATLLSSLQPGVVIQKIGLAYG